MSNPAKQGRVLQLPLISPDDGWSGTAHANEFGSYLEMLSRLLAAVVVMTSPTPEDVRIPRSGAGAGKFRSLLRVLSMSDDVSEAGRRACRAVNEAWDKAHTTGYSDGLDERNVVSHGGQASRDVESTESWLKSVSSASRAIDEYVINAGGLRLADGLIHLGESPLWPLLLAERDSILLFQSWPANEAPRYLRAGTSRPPAFATDPSVTEALKNYVSHVRKPKHEQIVSLRGAIEIDIRGFSSTGSSPLFRYGHDGQLSVEWQQRTSSGDVARVDIFRIGVENQRQWRSGGGGWRGYSDFVRKISNWDVVVQRLGVRHEGIVDHDDRESQRLTDESVPLRLPDGLEPRFRTESMRQESFATPDIVGADDLGRVLDEAAVSVAGLPQIFFLAGEAGIGKTYSLIRLAARRQNEIQKQGSVAPIVLYVSCADTSLGDIKDIVNAQVIDTQNLNFSSVLTLCRNGLMILVIDGFDELVEGAGYRDAYRHLAPAIQELRDRGSIVVSARTAYLANQYRSSIRKQEAIAGYASACHTVLELQRWSTADVERLFKLNTHWSPLRELLSPRDLNYLGVPFFSKVFNSFAARQEVRPALIDLHQVLIEGYLARELDKLADVAHFAGGRASDRTQSIGVDELYVIFREVAGIVFESTKMSVDQESFEMACSYALGVDLGEPRNRSLAARLSVLCGFSVTVSQMEVGFRFEHELFYEVFLAEFFRVHYLTTGKYEGCLDRLSRGSLGSRTVEDLVEKSPHEVLSLIKWAMSSTESMKDYLAQNISALAQRLISESEELGDIPALVGCQFQNVKMKRDLRESELVLDNCDIDILMLPEFARISLKNSRVHHVILRQGWDLQGRLSVDTDTKIYELAVLPQAGEGVAQYCSSAQEVWRALAQMRADGASLRLEEIDTATRAPDAEFATDVLSRLDARGDAAYIVQQATRTPGKTAAKGVYRPMDKRWAALTKAATQAGVAKSKQMTASGQAKTLVSFLVPPGSIIGARSDESMSEDQKLAVEEFWSLLGRPGGTG